MRTDLLLRRTRMYFPRFDVGEVKIAPIEKGGSDRKFYRVRCSPEQTLILVKYNLEREENRFSYRRESWLVRRAFYESALDEIARLHRLPDDTSRAIRQDLPAEFNAALYLWEQNYFLENCLGRYFGMNEAQSRELAALPALREIAEGLARLPRVLVHRDFQSQNILMRTGQAYLIDFQGMRPGLPEYDLASLLFDPYVDLSNVERAELIAYYRGRQTENGLTIDGDFDDTLRVCAMQRLMQALGAYGFLGLVKRHKDFLQYISPAMKSLRAIIAGIDGLQPLGATLDRLI